MIMISNSIGLGSDSDSQASVTKGGIYTQNVVITDTANQIQVAGKSAQDVINDAKIEYSTDDFANNNWRAMDALTNNFDTDKVLKELNIQVKVTQDFRKNSFGVIAEYADKKQADLREQIKQTTDETLKTQLYEEIYKVQYQRRLLKTLVGIILGTPDMAITQGTLQLAATKMREESLANSRQSPGVWIEHANSEKELINNISYGSGYFDGVKLGGTRLNLDVICGTNNERCKIQEDKYGNKILDEYGTTILATDNDGNYTFIGDKNYKFYRNLQNSKDFKDQIGATGGAQMHEGYLALTGDYKPGSFRDKLIESFAGTHDLLGGQIWDYYGDDGNTKRGSKPLQGVATGVAIPISAPFALADVLSSDFFTILFKLGGQ